MTYYWLLTTLPLLVCCLTCADIYSLARHTLLGTTVQQLLLLQMIIMLTVLLLQAHALLVKNSLHNSSSSNHQHRASVEVVSVLLGRHY
jgi:hypothetical protein